MDGVCFRFVRGGLVGALTYLCSAVAYLVRQQDKTKLVDLKWMLDSLNIAELLPLLLSCSRSVVGGRTGVYGI